MFYLEHFLKTGIVLGMSLIIENPKQIRVSFDAVIIKKQSRAAWASNHKSVRLLMKLAGRSRRKNSESESLPDVDLYADLIQPCRMIRLECIVSEFLYAEPMASSRASTSFQQLKNDQLISTFLRELFRSVGNPSPIGTMCRSVSYSSIEI